MKNDCVEWLGGEFYFNFHNRDDRYKPIEASLDHLKNKPSLNFLEIGSCEGQSTLWFIKTILTHASSKITCIDPHSEGDWYDKNAKRLKTDKTTGEIFKLNILNKYNEKVVYHKDRSHNVLPRLQKESYDVIYIDGAHSLPNVYMDAKLSKPLLKHAGVMIFDDIRCAGVKSAIQMLRKDDFFINAPFGCAWRLLHEDSVLIVKKC